MKIERPEDRKAKQARRLYDPIFERITSTAMLHHALSISFGVPVNKLAKMIDLKTITLANGPALQVVVKA